MRAIAYHLRDHEYSWRKCDFDFRTAHLEDVDLNHAASSSCWPGVVLPGLVAVAIAAMYKGYRYPIEIIGTRCGCITVLR